ncbi:hypothetical protein, partial [Escherichia coli]|uniref:hypothetical protein n=1 Tax=Escherichia coli TaxID=562 RepID=UPI002157DAFA
TGKNGDKKENVFCQFHNLCSPFCGYVISSSRKQDANDKRNADFKKILASVIFSSVVALSHVLITSVRSCSGTK